MVIISAGLLAYDVYDRVRRTIKNNEEKNALTAAEAEIIQLEKELAAAKHTKYNADQLKECTNGLHQF